jgi:hypothetical protein
MMKAPTRLAVAALVLLAGLDCACAPAPRMATPASARPAGEVRVRLLAWFECEECTHEQLDAVVALGADVVPTLAATLREGLSPASRARLELQLRERHGARVAYGLRRPGAEPVLDADAFVAHHLASRDALHRSRAATALGRIHTKEALEALRAELARDPPPSVQQSIRAALDERADARQGPRRSELAGGG